MKYMNIYKYSFVGMNEVASLPLSLLLPFLPEPVAPLRAGR